MHQIYAPMLEAKKLKKLEARLYSWIPLIGKHLRRRAAQILSQAARAGDSKASRALASAVTRSKDEQVRAVALETLRQLNTQACIDAVCEVWATTRHDDLSGLLIKQHWVASDPATVKVLSALLVEQLEIVAEGGAEVVEPLLQACEDSNPAIANRAMLLLRQLKNPEAKDALCHFIINRDHPIAREAAIAARYAPRDEYQRALFFFLTEQWGRYESLDFDRRLLRTVYESADATLRQRITEKLRAAGRTDFLTVIAGGDYRSRAAVMTPSEADFLVQMLEVNKEWTKLWALAFELPFSWSVRIIKILARNSWKPEMPDERATFDELVSLASAEMAMSGEEVSRLLPPAAQRAWARVPGRINDVAFSPARPVIAIGTAQRKVVLWNFQKAEQERVLDGFDHSIGRVTFTQDDVLLCAERTNSDAECAIYGWHNGEKFLLGEHRGSVTAIEPAGNSQALATGRDFRVVLWDVRAGHKVRQQDFNFWARAARVSPDGQRAALLHEGVMVVSLPDMTALAGTSDQLRRSVSRCAAFAPDGKALIIGKFNGEVLVCELSQYIIKPERQAFLRHRGQMQTVEVLPNRSTVITASSDGAVHFTSWTNRAFIGGLQILGERLTSLHISPDGSFMAIGDSDASMSLWDLRVLDVPMLFARPFGRTIPIHLAAINAAMANAESHPHIQRALRFMECILRHRFRYDIEIDEMPTIQLGEFDIEID